VVKDSALSVIQLDQLTRRFKDLKAISSISLDIHKGELFGLVGPDGAGKTTLLRTLAGLLKISEGEGYVAGFDLKSEYEQVKSRIGYMAQQFGLYAELNVVENLQFFADVFDVPRAEVPGRMDVLLQFANLTEFKDRRADRLSGGMQKKLALACCLIHQPEILLLDEPTTGVDPISRREFWHILGDLHLEGTTIVVSTPYMDEADRCSRVGLMYEGKLIRSDTPESIKEVVPAEMLVLIPENGAMVEEVVSRMRGVLEVQVYGEAYHIMVEDAQKQEVALKRWLKLHKIKYRDLFISKPKMEEAFISLMGRME
jgi:ABC-2 type transport system ATP-binding protein